MKPTKRYRKYRKRVKALQRKLRKAVEDQDEDVMIVSTLGGAKEGK